MSKQNKIVREELEKIYGHICMLHEGLNIKGYSKSKIKYTGKAIERQLTFHHIKPRSKGGATCVENGAVLCRGCHDYLELTTPENREKLNDLLKRYKKIRVEQTDEIETDFEIDLIEIEPTERDLTVKKYGRYNRAKVKRETRKAKEEYQRDDCDP